MSAPNSAQQRARQAQVARLAAAAERPRRWRRQLAGLAVGALLGLLAELLLPGLAGGPGQHMGIFYGAALGGVAVSLPEFAAAGAVITRSDRYSLNLALGLGVPAALLGLLYLARLLF